MSSHKSLQNSTKLQQTQSLLFNDYTLLTYFETIRVSQRASERHTLLFVSSSGSIFCPQISKCSIRASLYHHSILEEDREVKWHPSELKHSGTTGHHVWRQKTITLRRASQTFHRNEICLSPSTEFSWQIPFNNQSPRTAFIIKQAETLQFHHLEKHKW